MAMAKLSESEVLRLANAASTLYFVESLHDCFADLEAAMLRGMPEIEGTEIDDALRLVHRFLDALVGVAEDTAKATADIAKSIVSDVPDTLEDL
jgi:hypothetical protein